MKPVCFNIYIQLLSVYTHTHSLLPPQDDFCKCRNSLPPVWCLLRTQNLKQNDCWHSKTTISLCLNLFVFGSCYTHYDFHFHFLSGVTVLHMKSVCFQIRMTVDDNFQEEYIFSDDVQFLTAAEVWLGGTPNTFERTGGNVRTNFDGGVALVSFLLL